MNRAGRIAAIVGLSILLLTAGSLGLWKHVEAQAPSVPPLRRGSSLESVPVVETGSLAWSKSVVAGIVLPGA